MSTYFAAEYNRDLYFFYPSNNLSTLHCRIWRDGRLLPESTLHTGIKMPYSVFHQEGRLHVFCQNTQNNTLLLTSKKDEWHSRVVLQKGNDGVFITPMPSEDGLCILYNGFAEADTSCLFKRLCTPAGEWRQAEVIDRFAPFPVIPYEAQATGPDHLILFYQTCAEECQVGYREITTKRTGPFHRFLNIRGTLMDSSYLTTLEDVHMLMIVKTAFSCQLLYRKKTEDVFTPEILLWEAPRIEQCLLTIVKDKLYAACMIGGKLHCAVSADYGDNFAPMGIYKRKFCAEPVKANLVMQTNTKGYFARQVYVDRTAPWDVQMIPDLYPDFYPAKAEESIQLKELKDSLATAQRALDAKDRQIMELMYKSRP